MRIYEQDGKWVFDPEDTADTEGRRLAALEFFINDILGPEQVILRCTKLELLDLIDDPSPEKRLTALERVVHNDATFVGKGDPFVRTENLLATIGDLLARRTFEDRLEKLINDRMQDRQDDYYRDIKLQVLKEQGGPEDEASEEKFRRLLDMEEKKLRGNAMEKLRPKKLTEVIGQDRAVEALMTKLVSPYPQHVIVYGPPGVGKTSAARLVLEMAKTVGSSAFEADAPFIEVDGATLRWDPREATNPLLGSVHDPIYQGAKRDLAETGIPEPKPGLVTDANGGVLFIDEIGEMDPMLLNKLLKVLEDKRVRFDSSYYDAGDEMVPAYIRYAFEKGFPADFILVAATTRDESELNPALRSRCAAVYFDPLSGDDITAIVNDAAVRLGVRVDPDAAALIAAYTIDGRKAAQLLADAYGLLTYEQRDKKRKRRQIKRAHVEKVLRNARLAPRHGEARFDDAIGKIKGLGVAGFIGSVIDIEAVSFPASKRGKGTIRFNDTAGSMAKDSVFNAASVYRSLTGEDLGDHDIHVNIVGGGNIDGPSAGLAIFLAIYSSIKDLPLPGDLAVTGEISLRGKVCPVGGVAEKLHAAAEAGVKRVIIPAENGKEAAVDRDDMEIETYATVADVVETVFR